jgi:hypothetical protein
MANAPELDSYFMLDTVMAFLMINYNMFLGTIYAFMVLSCAVFYYMGLDSGRVRWLPFFRQGNSKILGIAIGIGAGVGFLAFYNYLATPTAMSSVFATTAFGSSESLGKIVYGLLVPLAETRFFFRTLMQWFSDKAGTVELLSEGGIKILLLYSAIFVLFHATAKGVANTIDLFAVFAFGALSLSLILFFKQIIEAVVAHIVVNGKAVGLFDMFTNGTIFTGPYMIGIALIGGYLLYKNNMLPFVSKS